MTRKDHHKLVSKIMNAMDEQGKFNSTFDRLAKLDMLTDSSSARLKAI